MTVPIQFKLAFRLTVASVFAMSLAASFQLTNPWWAAMAVWMVGQPPRGPLLERGMAQFVGALAGALAGAVLTMLPGPGLVAAGLALWLALCCALASAMRHQRSYGAALCGLTASVIVILTLGTGLDPVEFAMTRAADNVIGILCAVLVGLVYASGNASAALVQRSRSVVSDALRLVADALMQSDGAEGRGEHAFLLSLARLHSSSEDAAAGSISARRRLRSLDAVFAACLDLIVISRALRDRATQEDTAWRAHLSELHDLLKAASQGLEDGQTLTMSPIRAKILSLKDSAADLGPILGEMDILLDGLSRDHTAFEDAGAGNRDRLHPHPDLRSAAAAGLRGGIIVGATSAVWLLTGIDAIRFACLAAAIFTVLFASADEPAALVRQILIGALAASACAMMWRLAIAPSVTSPWIGIALTTPLIFAASLVQARQGTMFIGLAFNMLFAVQARAMDLSAIPIATLFTTAIALLAGIAVSYSAFRWVVPMDVSKRKRRLRASIRREIAAIAQRTGTPWGDRHMARLRFLVLGVAIRSGGQVDAFEDALSALTLGHIAKRLGDLKGAQYVRSVSPTPADALKMLARPITDAETLSADFRRFSETQPASSTFAWLLKSAAANLDRHGAFLSEPQG